MDRVVELGDLPLLLYADEGRRTTALEYFLGGLPESSAPPQLTLRCTGSMPTLPGRAPEVKTSQIELWFDGADLAAREVSGFGARVSRDEAWIGGSSLDPTGALGRLLLVALTHLLFERERFVLHAGAIERQGRALLLLGASGMGKSSLAYAASRAGWNVLADDVAIVRRGSEQGFDVAGLTSRPVLVPRELVAAGEEPPQPATGGGRNRRAIKELIPRPGWSAVSGSVLAGHADGANGTSADAQPTAALAVLLASFLGTVNPRLLSGYFAVAGQLARYPSVQIMQASEPQSRLRDIEKSLGRLT